MAAALVVSGCTGKTDDTPAKPPALDLLFTMDTASVQHSWTLVQQRDKETLRLLGSLTSEADKALHRQVTSVTDKPDGLVAPSHDKHDYYSLRDYYWPNANKPGGAYELHDGQKNPEVDTIPDRANLRQMLTDVNALALAYYLGDNKKYAERAAQHLRAWFIDANTKMNPHLKYAQMIKNNPREPEGKGIIDAYNMPMMLDAIRLLQPSGVLNDADKTALRDWIQTYHTWLITSDQGRNEVAYGNNRETWFRAQVIAVASWLGTVKGASVYTDTSIFERQIQPDGTQPKELERTISWTYSTFNLTAMFRMVLAAKPLGPDLFRDNPRLLAAVRYLIPYALGAKWPHEQLGVLDPTLLAPVLAYAAVLYGDPDIVDASRQIPPSAAIRLSFPLPRAATPSPSSS